jgi:hypothetical protein
MRLVKMDHDSHDFTQTQLAGSPAGFETAGELLTFPSELKSLAKFIDMA